MSLGTMEQRAEGMKKQAQELIEQAYQRGYEAGQENALTVDSDKYIEQGRNEAWEAAKKIVSSESEGGLSFNELLDLFGTRWFGEIFNKFSASEVIEKLYAYEEQKKQEEDEIKVGDEVYLLDGNYHSVVTSIYDSLGIKKAVCITQNGKWVVNDIDNLHKTGRTFPEIAEVLKKMQEGE